MSPSTRPTEVFPERLKKARELRSLTQADLARRAEFDPSAVSHFEAGSRKPSLDNLRKLADALDVTTDYLVGRATSVGEPGADPADPMYRHLQNLSSADRDPARDLVGALAERARKRPGTK